MERYKEYDIVVVTDALKGTRWPEKGIGYMFQLAKSDAHALNNEGVIIAEGNKYGTNYRAEYLRKATQDEINAYNRGIRHIQKLAKKPEVIEQYPIY